MCDFTNEPNSLVQFMALRIITLEEQLEELKLLLIEARNPGVDIEAIREHRRMWAVE